MNLAAYLAYTALLVVIDALHDWARRRDKEYLSDARVLGERADALRERGRDAEADAAQSRREVVLGEMRRYNVLWHQYSGWRIGLAAFALGWAAFGPALSDGTILAAFAALVLFAGLRWVIHDGILNHKEGAHFGYVGTFARTDRLLRWLTRWTPERPRPWRVVAVKVAVLAGAVWSFAAALL